MTKKEKLRELLCAGINELIMAKMIKINDFTDEGEPGALFTEVLGKSSKISWRYISHGEILISVWWGLKPKCIDTEDITPYNTNKKDAVDACCSGWLERKDGVWLQGQMESGLVGPYCAKSAEAELFAIEDVKPLGYNKEGKYYM